MKYRGDITPKEYAAMEDGYEQGRAEGKATVTLHVPADMVVTGVGPAQAFAAPGTYVITVPAGGAVTVVLTRGQSESQAPDGESYA